MTAPGPSASSLHAPSDLDRYLLPSERLVVAVRRHPARLLEPVLSAVGGLVAAGWLDTYVTGGVPVVADAVWLGWVVLVLRAIWELAQWRQDWFVATDQRLILTYGLLTRKVAMMPLSKVTDLSYNRSPLGRLLGYGEFVLESAGQDQAMRAVAWLPSPDVLYRRICAEIFDPRHFARSAHTRPSGPSGRLQHAPAERTHDTEEVAGWEAQRSAASRGRESRPGREPEPGREPDPGREPEPRRESRPGHEPGPGHEPDPGHESARARESTPDPALGPTLPDGTERPMSRWGRRRDPR